MAQQIHNLRHHPRLMKKTTTSNKAKPTYKVTIPAARKPSPSEMRADAQAAKAADAREEAAKAAEAAKGYTRDGKPRQRDYRTYFAVTPAGRVMRYSDYEAREIDVRNGSVKRVTAGEARVIEARGLRPSPLVVSTQWSPSAEGRGPSTQRDAAWTPKEEAPNGANRQEYSPRETFDPNATGAFRVSDRKVIEVQALLDNTMRTLAELQAKMAELDPDAKK